MKLDLKEAVGGGGGWTGLNWLRIGTGGGFYERGNGVSGAIKCGEFFY